MRGEDSCSATSPSTMSETPPRAWGRLLQVACDRRKTGNTPTCVGKTAAHRHRSTACRKHPHVRGEDQSPYLICLPYPETPPRAWGRPGSNGGQPFWQGNTPTCVGKTRDFQKWRLWFGKHPHVRGEDTPGRIFSEPKTETPPRAWGRLDSINIYQGNRRNTPTCVGKTSENPGRWIRTQKHPHVRGEDLSRWPGRCQKIETPPRAWGRPIVVMPSPHPVRNTPTCVGKTTQGRSLVTVSWKHPHVRGEDSQLQAGLSSRSETPPRAWGRPVGGAILVLAAGNTPTCVGKTAATRVPKYHSRKHPHVRGEDACGFHGTALSIETPPRAWGRPLNILVAVIQHGNTPTCVGKTSYQ